MLYLDHNATTPPCPAAAEAMASACTDLWPNPSSGHREGQRVRHAVESARESVAALLGARPKEITFTSGGTESIHLAIRGILGAAPPDRRTIITSAVEHEAVRELADHLSRRAHDPITVRTLPVDTNGLIDPASLAAALDPSVALVSIQWANNETGAIQPIAELGALCRDAHVPFHTDATQWVGKMPTDLAALPIDLLTCSAHKFHGPKGIGALFARTSGGIRLAPQLYGTQERQRRAGTENVPGILAMAAAAEEARVWLGDLARTARSRALRDRLEHALLAAHPDARINAADAPRLWNTCNIGFPRLEAEALVLILSELGLCASAGAACASGSLDPSPVLKAMRIPDPIAHGSIRLSISRDTTEDEIDRAIPIITEAVRRLTKSAASVV
jgi:cysteine desulfurase